MGRGAWLATVHGVARVGHNLVTKPPFKYNFYKVALNLTRLKPLNMQCLT